MGRFESYPSKAKLLGLLLLNIAMLAICIFCVALPPLEARLAGWAGTIFFGMVLLANSRMLFRTAVPKIVMDHAGIHTGSAIGIVAWEDIHGFRIDSIRGTKFLSVLVVDVTKYLDRMPPLARQAAEAHPQLGVSEIALCFVGLTPGLAEACYYLAERGYKIDDK